MTAARDSSVALGLGSSFLGYVAHGGFLAGLEETGLEVGHIAGSSSGALVAGLHAAGYRSGELRDILLDPEFRVRWLDWIFPARFIPIVIHFPGQVGLLSGKYMRRHLRKLLSAKSDHSEDTRPRLSIAVTNLTTGRTEWKDSGDIANWIIASCAVPGVFKPQRIDGQDYVDGGIADPVACANWESRESVNTVILHQITHPTGTRRFPWTFLRAIGRAHESMAKELFDLQVRLLRATGKKVIIAITETPRPTVLTGRRANERLWNLGRETGLAVAENLPVSAALPMKQTTCAPKSP